MPQVLFTSVTVTVWLQVAVLPLLSVTFHITVVTPSGNAEGALLTTDATPQLSATTGVPKTTPVAVHPVLVIAFTSGGQVIVGFMLSIIVTVKLQFVVPQEFVAVIVTFVTPTLNVDPFPVPLPLPVVAPVKTYERVVVKPCIACAVAVYDTNALHWFGSEFKEIFDGHVVKTGKG